MSPRSHRTLRVNVRGCSTGRTAGRFMCPSILPVEDVPPTDEPAPATAVRIRARRCVRPSNARLNQCSTPGDLCPRGGGDSCPVANAGEHADVPAGQSPTRLSDEHRLIDERSTLAIGRPSASRIQPHPALYPSGVGPDREMRAPGNDRAGGRRDTPTIQDFAICRPDLEGSPFPVSAGEGTFGVPGEAELERRRLGDPAARKPIGPEQRVPVWVCVARPSTC